MPTSKAKKPFVATKTDGLFQVRDSLKTGGKIWGEKLSYDDALKLKEQVTGSGKSRTARLEPMGSDTPRTSAPTKPMPFATIPPLAPGETTVDIAKTAALRAAASSAASAQARANARRPPTLPPPPSVVVNLPEGDNEYLDDEDLAGIMGEIGGNPTPEDITRAHAQAEADWKASDAKMREMEAKKLPIPDELVTYVGRVPEGYTKGDNGQWSMSAPGPRAA